MENSLKTLTDGLNQKSKSIAKLISDLTDELSFVETDRFIRSQTEMGEALGEGVVAGFAEISGMSVAIFATNPEVLSGSIGVKNADKIAKCVDNAIKTGLPVIGIFDTSGARFSEGIEAMEGYSKIISAFSRAYGFVPTIVVNKGNNYGLSSYLSAICDVCIGYEKASVSTSSPLIVSAKSGVDISKTGTSAVHSKQTGLFSVCVKSDKELKSTVSTLLNLLLEDIVETSDDPNRVSSVLKVGAKVDTVIKEIFDENSFFELNAEFASEIVTGFARLNGVSVGVVANNSSISEGRLTSSAAVKAAKFLNTCEAFDITVINLVDCKGVIVDINQENASLINDIASLLHTYNNLSVKKLALVFGDAIGVGYTAFASKSICDYVLAWESAVIGAIDGEKAAMLAYSDEIARSDKKDALIKKLSSTYTSENMSAVAVSKDGYVDNVIEPSFTRPYLSAMLKLFL